jgi:hypothetical protein
MNEDITDKLQAEREKRASNAPPTSNIVEEPHMDRAARLVRLADLLRDRPEMTLERMKASSDPKIMRLYTEAERLWKDGCLILIGGRLTFSDRGVAMVKQAEIETGADNEPVETITVRALEDVPTFKGPGGKAYKLNRGEDVTLPTTIARAFINAKKAEEVSAPDPSSENVPTATPEPSAVKVQDTVAMQNALMAEIKRVVGNIEKVTFLEVNHEYGSRQDWSPQNDRIITHAGVGRTELVIDMDGKVWDDIKTEADKVTAWLSRFAIPHYVYYTGGKGIHIHIFLDLRGLRIPDELTKRYLKAYQDGNADPFKIIRLAVLKYIIRESKMDEARAVLDTDPVDFDTLPRNSGSSDRKNPHLIRFPGCPRVKDEKKPDNDRFVIGRYRSLLKIV